MVIAIDLESEAFIDCYIRICPLWPFSTRGRPLCVSVYECVPNARIYPGSGTHSAPQSSPTLGHLVCDSSRRISFPALYQKPKNPPKMVVCRRVGQCRVWLSSRGLTPGTSAAAAAWLNIGLGIRWGEAGGGEDNLERRLGWGQLGEYSM